MAKDKKFNKYDLARKQVKDAARAERKLHQDMPRPQTIPDKKKQADKRACRGRT
jgi:hypothetical protein